MGLAAGVFVITSGWALAFMISVGTMARNLSRYPSRLDRYPWLKKAVVVLLWLLAAAGAAAVMASLWAAWSCVQAGLAIFG